mmetsp:Transcript_33385/g.72066  ORF Transcript_33385/g.72066 Transcript_33385/m.72066 type:complete len:477 (+) Transcript_33385:1-1431(+)
MRLLYLVLLHKYTQSTLTSWTLGARERGHSLPALGRRVDSDSLLVLGRLPWNDEPGGLEHHHGQDLHELVGVLPLQPRSRLRDHRGAHPRPAVPHAPDGGPAEEAVDGPGGVGIPRPARVQWTLRHPVGGNQLGGPHARQVGPVVTVRDHRDDLGVLGEVEGGAPGLGLPRQRHGFLGVGEDDVHETLLPQRPPKLVAVPAHHAGVGQRHAHQRAVLRGQPHRFHHGADHPLPALQEVPLHKHHSRAHDRVHHRGRQDRRGRGRGRGRLRGLGEVREHRPLRVGRGQHHHGPRGLVRRLRQERHSRLVHLGPVERPDGIAPDEARHPDLQLPGAVVVAAVPAVPEPAQRHQRVAQAPPRGDLEVLAVQLVQHLAEVLRRHHDPVPLLVPVVVVAVTRRSRVELGQHIVQEVVAHVPSVVHHGLPQPHSIKHLRTLLPVLLRGPTLGTTPHLQSLKRMLLVLLVVMTMPVVSWPRQG